MHSTSNEDDGYLGSGKRIKAEIKKYGHDNFTREILFRELSRKELEDREAQVVNEELLADPLCLNLKNGGEGGGKFYSTQQLKNASIAGNKSPNRNHAILQSKRNTTLKMRGYINHSFHCDWSGKKHSDESRQKMSASAQGKHDGEKNSQFGSCWVTDGVKPIKIKKEQLDEYLKQGFIRGR
jgi:hypothetical protein